MRYKEFTAEEAAAYINNGDIVGFSGFTPAGCPKAVPTAIAKRAEALHAKGEEFKIGMYSGASGGGSMDGALANANAILFRTPYQNRKESRARINAREAQYFDMHLSQLAQELRYGFLPRPKFVIAEAASISDDGKLIPTAAVGILPTLCNMADYIIIELNASHPAEIEGLHDIYEPKDPPCREAIPVYSPSDRCGKPYIQIDPNKIVGIVHTNMPSEVGSFTAVDDVTTQIGVNVSNFLAAEMKAGRIPKTFLPIQSGVGNIANAMLNAMGANPDIPPFVMYTEVIQDSVIALMKKGQCKFASGCSLTCTQDAIDEIYGNLDFYKQRLVLRPSEISNSPEIARRIGIISINTALEADILGNVNSSHVLGTRMMNGIGGSCDFTRNAYLSIFTTPATAKGGKISAIVPYVSHLDHSEHSVKILATEYGVADLRGKSPVQRIEEIIEKCAAPEYRPILREYLKTTPTNGHTPLNIHNCFAMHRAFEKTGDMHDADFSYTL